MELTKFPMGFWNAKNTGELDAKAVDDWDDCGMTLAMSPEYDPAVHGKQALVDILDECQRRGIQVIVCDARAHWRCYAQDREGYRAVFQSAYEDFGRHPAVFGFHVGDEPYLKDIEDCAATHRIQKEIAPELTPYINHHPWKDCVYDWFKTDNYSAFMADFVRRSGAEVLSYDCYYQMNPEDAGIEMYYKNLWEYTAAAREAGVPLWTVLLSSGHFRYRCPSLDDFRWQISTAAASGCKGLIWFLFYELGPDSPRMAPIDIFGERTQTYYDLRRAVRIFMKQFAQKLLPMKLDRVWHVHRSYGGYPLFKRCCDPTLLHVEAMHEIPLVVSVFKDEQGQEFLCVVNNSQKESTQVTLTLREGKKELWLAPGQMELLRAEG